VVLARFKETYPFVTIDFYRDSGQIVIEKVLTEAKANQYFADIIEVDTVESYSLIQNELLAPFIAPESAAYPDNAKDSDGYWTVYRINTVVIAYNTQLVAPADVPTTWEELLDPKWQGKMAVEVSDVELLVDMAAAWGEEKTYAFWEGIAAQDPTIVEGHTELADALAAGEYAISPTVYAHRVERLKSKGQPIEWVKTDPVFAFTQSVALASHASHPATAKLFINWLLSEAGQTVIRDLGRIPARAGISSDPPALTEGLNFYYTVPVSAEDYTKYAEKWNSLFTLE
jgi:iron(III) transport system substrate-binding protein